MEENSKTFWEGDKKMNISALDPHRKSREFYISLHGVWMTILVVTSKGLFRHRGREYSNKIGIHLPGCFCQSSLVVHKRQR